MKQIVLEKLKDLEVLKSIDQNEDIYLKVSSLFPQVGIEGIDMHNYKGKINLYFDCHKYQAYYVCTDNLKRTKFFFKHLKDDQIHIQSEIVPLIRYYMLKSKRHIKTEQEFLMALQEIENHTELAIELDSDVIIRKNTNCKLTKCIVKGPYRIYLPRSYYEENIKYPSNVIFYDYLLDISNIYSLKQLEKYTNGTVIANIVNDFSDFKAKAVSLKNFSGNLYLLGNNHTIQYGTILGSSNNIGLFGVAHPYANIHIENLKMSFVNFLGYANYGGAFLGKRMHYDTPYSSTEGLLSLENCHINSLYFEFVKTVHPYQGLIDENLEVILCSYDRILNYKTFINREHYDNSTIFLPSSSDGNKRNLKCLYDELTTERQERNNLTLKKVMP